MNALRGEPNVQGACDMSVLYNYLFGYLDYPDHTEPTLDDWTKNNGTFRAEVRRERAQGLVRRERHPRERLRLRLAAEADARRRTTAIFGIFDAALRREAEAACA